jgi:putative glycosyltransferase (TIGR04348 family)
MRVCLVTPAPARSRKGNRVTALRWARLLRRLGHRVRVDVAYAGQPCDLLVALHAGRSFPSIARFHQENPGRPLILALTGTDLYDQIHTSPEARQSLEMASRLVVLQPLGVEELPEPLRPKARVIYQSVEPPRALPTPHRDAFEVCVLGHLRPVKDPFRTAEAARLLPAASRVRVLHLGAALSEDMAERARAEQAVNPRYRWLGELPRWKALRTLARSRLLSLTSKLEGGANVISEALVVSVPVVSSHIPGSVGLLGADYPGYFPFGDTPALAELLRRAECDPDFYQTLKTRCEERRGLFDPAREVRSWKDLLQEFSRDPKGGAGLPDNTSPKRKRGGI